MLNYDQFFCLYSIMNHIGVHIKGDILKEIIKVKQTGGNCVQMFTNAENVEEIKHLLVKNKMKVYIHSKYIYNLARNWNKYSWWLLNLEEEIRYAHRIGAEGIVLHTGNQLNLPEGKAINNMYTQLIYIHNKTKRYGTKIYLETSSGQGTEMLYKMEEFAKFFRKFSITPDKEIKKRFMVCLDTCHVFAAGYDLRSKNKIDVFIDRLNELIGLENIGLIHLNDAASGCGSRLDQHATIGNGEIGTRNILYLYKRLHKIPTIIETWSDINDIKLLANIQ